MEQKEFDVLKFSFNAKLATLAFCLSFLYFFCASYLPIPKDNMSTVNTIIGFLILNLGLIIGYYFGSSQSQKSRQQKDDAENNKELKP